MATAGTVADRETILRIDFFVPLLGAVLSSIKTRFGKQATQFMKRITAFSPENWVSENDEKSGRFTEAVRCLADYYSLEASVAVAQYNLFIRPKNNDALTMFVNETNDHSANTLPASLLGYMHKKKLHQVHSELYKLLEVCATIPVTCACNERSHTAN